MNPLRLPSVATLVLTALLVSACGAPSTPVDRPPSASIASPEEGATLNYLDYPIDGSDSLVPVVGAGIDAEGAVSLSWAYRVDGGSWVTDVATGANATIRLPLGAVSPSATVEFRLTVEDDAGQTSSDVVSVFFLGVQS